MWGPALSARHNNWEERCGGHAHSRYDQTAGGGLIGRFWGRTPSPTAGGSQRDPGRFQVGPGSFAMHTGGPLDTPQRPCQPPQCYDLS